MAHSTHAYRTNPCNEHVKININGELFFRHEAKISVFDSAFMLGDGVWEGLRVHKGKVAFLSAHLQRLYAGAKALDFYPGISKADLTERIYATIEANQMHEGVHIRLIVSRGTKSTPYQDPRVTITPPTIVIIPEYKEALPKTLLQGIDLFTVHVRRGFPDVQDPKLNSHSKINCILACIQATKAGAAEALMLDPHGFVATCNSTHFFIVKDNCVITSTGQYCLNGITRKAVLDICREQGIAHAETNFSLSDVYSADEAFVTGTFAGLVPVTVIDGRFIGADDAEGKAENNDSRGPMVKRLQSLYQKMLEQECS
ncbi:MAG: aminotransferase class IV [Gammaproteobacteria bacterium]|nr:aminotransferase class IV [Gammaproteobacteria bacterium]